MALITCPECTKIFSDKASNCPNCGCPTEQIIKNLEIQKILIKYKDVIDNLKITYKCNVCGNTEFDTEIFAGILMSVCTKCKNHANIVIVNQEELNQWKQQTSCIKRPTTPECPYCHSHDTKKIGSGGRTLSLLTLGLAGSKIGKQWHCKHCGSDF